jgi:hypothetical protein
MHETDILVVGGSCTGVFAAVRAARLGARVAIVEKQNCFGGVATAGLVNIWHSPFDEGQKRKIIAGLTEEVIGRLDRRDAVHHSAHPVDAFRLNTEELKIELDELITEHRVEPFLHTMFCAPILKDGALIGVAVENKSGRGAILAKVFIDASGDGDLARRSGCAMVAAGTLQPPTTCAKYLGMQSLMDWDWKKAVDEHGSEFGLEPDWGWGCAIPGLQGMEMHADTHVFNADLSKGDVLTRSEIEGRRKVRAVLDVFRKYGPAHSRVALAQLAQTIGARETDRVQGQYSVTGEDLLAGRFFDDAIALGSYRVDIHHEDKPGTTFRYLNGVEVVNQGRAAPPKIGRWRPEIGTDPTFYSIPLRSLVQEKIPNLMLAGRMLDADKVAYSAVRVMVNLNQTGEAAGVAAYLALHGGAPVQKLDAQAVRRELAKGGSIVE